MAIYPILPGQKASDRNVIPPHTPARHSATENKPAAQASHNDLIDFGQNDASPAAPVLAENTAAKASTSQNSTEIQDLLATTGHEAAGGPLLDFTKDMKHDLPQTQPSTQPQLSRSETEDSNDVFFDVESSKAE